MEELYVGVDIGGSHVGVCAILGASSVPLEVVESHLGEDKSAITVTEIISGLINRILGKYRDSQGRKLRAIGIGCPGQSKDGILVAASNFPSWHNVPLVEIFRTRYGVHTYLFKDSDAAFAGEIWGDFNHVYGDVKNAVMIS